MLSDSTNGYVKPCESGGQDKVLLPSPASPRIQAAGMRLRRLGPSWGRWKFEFSTDANERKDGQITVNPLFSIKLNSFPRRAGKGKMSVKLLQGHVVWNGRAGGGGVIRRWSGYKENGISQ